MLPPDQQHIVVGVDGSISALQAALWASEESVRTDSALCLVVVHEDEALQYYAARTVEEVSARCRTLRPELCVVTSVVLGDPVECLIRESRNAHELVLGGLGGKPLGSVSAAVAGRAHCPVVLTNGTSGSWNGPVVVGLHEDGDDAPLLQYAFEAAALREDPRLEIVRSWHESDYGETVRTPLSPHHGERLRQALEHWLSERSDGWAEKYPEVRVSRSVRGGQPVPVLTRTSENAALLIVGRGTDGNLARNGSGSTLIGVTRHANRPVAVVPLGSPSGT
ncbi:Universal stress protein family protein [Actinopolyspora mzabensis]|uniref:Universal stress protein family protein n=1 Tax=Actinopolyspora mzabensis TaxID=995066 RepID=A0A1G8Z5P3_ACTMZ|nr:universal stress protein [Actinopolyspora mzabensis]SDK10283.1 Universal stress protein family protein [Actinopolyspora mzabensis]